MMCRQTELLYQYRA